MGNYSFPGPTQILNDTAACTNGSEILKSLEAAFQGKFPEVSGDVKKSDLLIKEYRLATKNLASIGELLPEPLGKLQHLRSHPQKSAITTWELGACEVCG